MVLLRTCMAALEATDDVSPQGCLIQHDACVMDSDSSM